MKNCPLCKQSLPEGFKPKRPSRAGRPISIDYAMIKKLKRNGMSIRNIAKTLGCSPYSVFCGTR